MKRYNKIILISAGAAIVIGGAVLAAGITLGGASDRDISYNSETITEKIKEINIDTDCDDVIIKPVGRNDINIRYVTGGKRQYTINADNGVLTINHTTDRSKRVKWYDYVNFDFGLDREMVIEVPNNFEADINIESNYGDIKVSDIKGSLSAKLDCGDFEISGCEFSSLECQNDYGDIEISRVTSKKIRFDNNCGDIALEDVSGDITAKCDLGDIEFEYVSGDNLDFAVDCGDIEGLIRGRKADYSEGGTKKLKTKTNFGDINIKFTE